MSIQSSGPSPVHIDWQLIALPSDLLTIGQIREAHPIAFDAPSEEPQPKFFLQANHEHHASDVLGRLLTSERLYFENAVRMERSTDYRSMICDSVGVQRYLVNEYVRLGLANGPHQAQQLIRSLKKQATVLAGTINDLSG